MKDILALRTGTVRAAGSSSSSRSSRYSEARSRARVTTARAAFLSSPSARATRLHVRPAR